LSKIKKFKDIANIIWKNVDKTKEPIQRCNKKNIIRYVSEPAIRGGKAKLM